MEYLLIFIAIVLGYILLVYNGIVRAKNKVKQAESGIEVYLNQRFDLIPNLVETVKAYAKHEEQIFNEITAQRINYMNNDKKTLEDGAKLNNNCNKILAIAESYPELKASEQFLNLQKNLSKMESQLQAARRIYNGEVTRYNNKIMMFPSNLIASIFKFKEMKLFEIEEYKKDNVKVEM